MNRKDIYQSIQRILTVFAQTRGEVKPHFFLTGPTGSSKTYTIESLTKKMGIELITVNAAQLTVEGISGNSVSKSLSRLRSVNGAPVIVLWDEFDKLLDLTNNGSGLSSDIKLNVQDEMLKVVEGGESEVFGDYGKYATVPCDNILHIFAGAFAGQEIEGLQHLTKFGVKPELLGRVGLHYHLEKMPVETMVELLSKSDLLQDYCVLFSKDKEEALSVITDELKSQYDNNIIGVRLLATLTHQYFIDGKFTSVTSNKGYQGKETKKKDLKPIQIDISH